jgi:hypothetical protein
LAEGFFVMKAILRALIELVVSFVWSRVSLLVEIVALRHQLAVYQRTIRRPVVRASDRIFWAWLPGIGAGGRRP